MSKLTFEEMKYAKCFSGIFVSLAVVMLFIKPGLAISCLIPILFVLPMLTSKIGDEPPNKPSCGDGAVGAGASSSSGGCDGC